MIEQPQTSPIISRDPRGRLAQAQRIARSVWRFWSERGVTTVRVWVEPEGDDFCIKSNMINGMPPHMTAKGRVGLFEGARA